MDFYWIFASTIRDDIYINDRNRFCEFMGENILDKFTSARPFLRPCAVCGLTDCLLFSGYSRSFTILSFLYLYLPLLFDV